MKNNPFSQTVNFYISTCFIAAFGLFMTTQILNAWKVFNPNIDNPITDSVQATQQALVNY
ncbi:MAG TPA: hypothetical protein VMU27_01715 [Candidatus Paceibacterota bacterium]|nr:hypothetical protein [Candidatus Paceibacterota bacterium]